MEVEILKTICQKYHNDSSQIMSVLLDIQEKENWIAKEDMEVVSKELNVPITRVYSLSTFFTAFSLVPKGKHQCHICTGTACHVKGAVRLVDHLERDLKIKPGQTTEDRMWSFDTVHCVGSCALAPVVLIDGEYHGGMDPAKLDKVVKKIRKEDK